MNIIGDAKGEKTAGVLAAGPFRLDRREGRLTRDGVVLALSGKPLALLDALMRAAPRLVTKEEIFDQIWFGRAVSEAVLTTAIRQIRNALGDDARSPTIIETVHGRGYRFLLPVADAGEAEFSPPPAAPPAKAPSKSPRRLAAAIAPFILLLAAALFYLGTVDAQPPIPVVHPKSIVVLPLKDLSADDAESWFADGLTEELLNKLSRTQDLRVASRSAGQSLAAESNPVAAARSVLHAANLLEGSVRRANGRVRVTVRLTRTEDGLTLWSQDYDQPQQDIIDIQEKMAFEIATALKTVMEPEKLRAMVEAGTRSVEAYEAFLRAAALGRKSLDTGDIVFARASREAYERAREIDPGFAAAHWAAASTWFGSVTRTDAKSVPEGKTYAELLTGYFERVDAAIANSRDDIERERYMAARDVFRMEPKSALGHINAYLKARPRDSEAWDEMARIAAYSGDLAGVSRAASQLHKISLENGVPLSRAITTTVMAREPRKAVRRARQQLALQPDGALMNYQAHRAFIQTGKIDEARPMLGPIEASSLSPEVKQLATMRQACAEKRLGDAQAIAEEIYAAGSLGARWQAAQILGDDAKSHEFLAPLDTEEGLPTLVQFMFQPTFDAGDYPVLKRRLERAGAIVRKAGAMPYSCRSLAPSPSP